LDIRITTENSGSLTSRNLCMMVFHRRSFSLCLSTGTLRRAPSFSTKDSKPMANRVAGGLNPPAPTPSAFAKAMTGQDVLWNGVAALSVQNHRKVKGTNNCFKKYSSASSIVVNVKKKLLKDRKFSNRVSELAGNLIKSHPVTPFRGLTDSPCNPRHRPHSEICCSRSTIFCA
jgi:hypothetical protein